MLKVQLHPQFRLPFPWVGSFALGLGAKENPISTPRFKNRLLASLPPAEIRDLASGLKRVSLPQGKTIGAAGKPLRDIFFVEEGLASIVTTMKNGRSVEVAVVGTDGFVGIPALLGTASMPNRTFMQVPGFGFRLNASYLTGAKPGAVLREKALKYVQAHLVQASQTAACNRLHGIAHRLARWILLCHDRMESDTFEITQSSLADMLGAPRPTVSIAAGALKNAGAIGYSRGRLTIVNRAALEEAACECYGVIRNECRRLGVL
jgi:CRP-like cAMP-binding protein